MNDSKKELAAELRRLADYAENESIGANVVTGANIGDAISLMLDVPGGEYYADVHAQIVNLYQAKRVEKKIVDELEQLHASTIEAQTAAVKHPNEIVFYRSKCHALAVAARLEAKFIEGIKDVSDVHNGKRKRSRHIPYKQALEILKKLNVPKNRKTLQRWMNGTNTPEDFTPECMHSIQSFGEWAKIYANREKSKINANNALRIDNPKNDRMRKFR